MISFKDTISNLTLTGSNSNLSNKSFLEKEMMKFMVIEIVNFI